LLPDAAKKESVRGIAPPDSGSGGLPAATQQVEQPDADRQAERLAVIESYNVQIKFFGKVVDQDGAPLSGGDVKAKIRRLTPGSVLEPHGVFLKKQARTSADGTFEFKDATGMVLTIEALEKENYEPEPNALRSFGYNISTNIVPDPNNPIVLRMWRADVKEPLLSTADGSSFAILTMQKKKAKPRFG